MTLDIAQLRSAFGQFPTGVTIVTTMDGDVPLGFTANSFTSVSLNPPMLLVCPGKQLSCFQQFANSNHFAVHILAEGSEALATKFATHKGDRFSGENWSLHPSGVPWLEEAAARFICQTHQVVDAGDHVILIGNIVDFERQDIRGLGFMNGQFFSLSLEAQVDSRAHESIWAGIIAAQDDKIYLEPDGGKFSIPKSKVSSRESQRQHLVDDLKAQSLDVAVGRVYSIFQNQNTLDDYHIFLGQLMNAPKEVALLDIGSLDKIEYTNPADASIMKRYQLEFQHRNFGLYIGNETKGDLHFSDEIGRPSV